MNILIAYCIFIAMVIGIPILVSTVVYAIVKKLSRDPLMF